MLSTVLAVSYEAMAEYLSPGASPLSWCAVESARHDRTWIISVTNSDRFRTNVFEDWPDGVPPRLVEDGEDRIALSFDDALPYRGGASPPSEGEIVLFDRLMADRICHFVDRVVATPGNNLLLVNCHAGVSRSGAIAAFAREVGRVDYDAFCRANPQIVPNVHVYGLLRDVWEFGLEGWS